MGWLNIPIRWLAQWMPEIGASIIVYGALCFVVGVPLAEAWEFVRVRWWVHLRRNERRLFLLFVTVGTILVARGNVASIPQLIYGGLLSLAGALAVVVYSIVVRRGVVASSQSEWEIRSETAPGFPVISWWQDVDTGLQQKHAQNNVEFNIMLWMLVGGPVIGWILGDWTGAAIGLALAMFFVPGVNRYSTPPKLENVGGYAPMPGKWGERQPTELERRIEGEPITEAWEAQASIIPVGGADLIEGEPYFVVRWRNAQTGETRLMCYQQWALLSPFELDSFEKLFGFRGTPLQYRDPWVITVRTDAAGVLELARDMAGQARLQTAFLSMARAFGVDRRTAFLRERAAQRRERGLDMPATPAAPAQSSGIRQRPPL